MKSVYLSCPMCLLLALTACGHKQEEGKTSEESRVIKVETETVQVTKEVSTLHYSGTIEPMQTIPLSFQNTGIVDNVFVQEGDMVRKGQILATVNKGDNESLYSASVAKYNQAKDAYDRLKSVYDQGSLPEIKWVEMETNLKQAEAQMQITKSNLEKCNMRAPDDGMIGQRNVEPGQSAIFVGTPIELVKIETVLVKVAVPENEISRIKKGQKASFSISALDGKTFEGTVTNVGVVADRISRTYEVKIAVKNDNFEMKPGMVCDVTLNAGSQREVVLVSYNSVSKESNGEPFVYLVAAGSKSVKKQHITVGRYNGFGIEVLDGLSVGETIVSEGKEKLSDNSLIRL